MLVDRYIANLKEASQLVKLRVGQKGRSDEEILAQVQGSAEKLRQLYVENNDLLREMVFSKTPENLTEEGAQELSEMADKLFRYARSIDAGISFRIHKLLYAYAQLHGDRDRIIRELYYQGLTCFYLNLKIADMEVNVFRDEISRYFSAGAAYLDQWEEITSEETRGYIIRCMANRNLVVPRDLSRDGLAYGKPPEQIYDEYMRNFEETMRVVQSPVYRAQNPGIPWDSFAYSMLYDRTSFLSVLRQCPNEQLQKDVMESAEYVYQHQEFVNREKPQSMSEVRTIYIYAAARFHSGRIPATELMDTLLAVYEQTDRADFSLKGIQMNIMYPQYLSTYAEYLTPEERERYQPQVVQAMHNLYRYLLEMPRNEYINRVASAIRDIMRSFSDQKLFYVQGRLLDTILACHAPTYIHSVMVAWLNQRITAQLIRTAPEVLEGVFGFSGVENIRANKESICGRAYNCGLYHDLGKSMVINYIGIYGRRLLEEEFRCIQYHAEMGGTLLESFSGMEDLAEAALHHHQSYNGKSGYPKSKRECSDAMREIVYITTVSDSIDAATDSIGRSYMQAKPYDTLVGELFQRSGTFYAPEIVRLFEDREFRESLGRDMMEYRKSVYCKVYRELE